MKPPILFYLLLVVFASSCTFNTYTYIPQMPNEPAFNNGGQFKSNIATGRTHIEMQGAFSPIKNIGITGGFFMGEHKQTSFDYGIMVYSKLLKNNNIYVSAGYSRSEGRMKTKFKSSGSNLLGGVDYYNIHCYYTGNHFQYSIYLQENGKSNARKKMLTTYGLLIKHSYIDYKKLYYSHKYMYSTSITSSHLTDRKDVLFKSISAMFFIETDITSSIYMLMQCGIKPSSQSGYSIYSQPKTQKVFWLPNTAALNIAFGIKIN